MRLVLAALFVVALATPFIVGAGSTRAPRKQPAVVAANLPRLPLAFEPAAGRFGRDVSFVARRGGYALGLMRDGSTVLEAGSAQVRTTLIGARGDAPLHAESRLPGTVSSYVGDDKSRWRSGLPTYGAVRYINVLPGVDLRYHGREGELEYDYILTPGADPARIVMRLDGGTPRLTRSGDLVIRTAAGPLRQRRPVAYQEIGGARVRVPARFDLSGRRVGFHLGAYDKHRPLVIDPQLVFTTYLGGTGGDTAKAASVMQTNGSTYLMVGGSTLSPSFHGSNQNADPAHVTNDTYVSKLSADGSSVIATTFVGGSSGENLFGLATGAGHVYITGSTTSTDLPTSVSLTTPFDATYNAGDSFIARLDPTDLSLEVVTYFPGPSQAGIAFSNFTVVVAGSTNTSGLATGGAYDTVPASTDAFAAAFNASLTQRKWASYVGSSAEDDATGIALDSSANVYLTGYAVGTTDFPVTVGSGTGTFLEGFLLKLSADGTSLPFARLYGGTDSDVPEDIWVSITGSVAIIGGWSDSSTLPGISGSSPAAGIDGWVTTLSTSSTTTFGGTWLGGTGTNEEVSSIGLDPFGGSAYAVGVTDSTNFPTVNAVQPQNAGGTDAFVVRLGGNATGIATSTYLGGSGNDQAEDVALDPANAAKAYVVGSTNSTNFGATATYSENATNPVAQPDSAGAGDAFVARVQPLSAKITGGPAEGSTAASATANFTFGPTSETGGGFLCKLDGGSFATCTTPKSYPGLAEGAHTFSAYYVDPANGTDGTVAVRHWTVDTTPPLTFALQAPADGATVTSTPAFTWDATTDALSAPLSYELWVDGVKRSEAPSCAGGSCSVAVTSALADGAHTWQIHAIDAVGNVRASATRNMTVDAAGPTAPVLTDPSADAEIASAQPVLKWSAASDAGSGLADYDIELDGRAQGLQLPPSTLSFTPARALAEGSHDWRVIATDQFGNSTTSAAGRFRVDLTPPGAQLTASPNPMLAGRTVTLDASASSDPAGGRIVRYEWDLDGDGSFEVDAGTTPTVTKAFNSSGSYLLAVRVTDPVGQTRVAATTLIVTTPPVPVGQLGVTINNGAQYTRSADVTLNLKFPGSTTQFLVSNDGGFLAPTTFSPKQEISWKLDSSGPERLPKTVYVRFLLSGIVSETYTDDIILDETPPVVQQAVVAPAGSGAARAAKLETFTVKVKATDSNSGVDAVQISASKAKPGRFLKYKTKLSVKAATRKLFVRARDKAGNLSAWKKAR